MIRLLRILAVALRFRLYRFLPRFAGGADPDRALRLREALEALGPIFVKFGQVLSTRRDLLPLDIADELARLQDQVPPFPAAEAAAEIERGIGRKISEVFAEFAAEPVASASVAQVHLARLMDGREVAVKVLRPGVEAAIAKDVALLETAAGLLEKLWADGRRLKPRQPDTAVFVELPAFERRRAAVPVDEKPGCGTSDSGNRRIAQAPLRRRAAGQT